MADIQVERVEVDVSTNGQTYTLTNDVGNLSSAFIRVMGPVNKHSAGRTDSTANMPPDQVACRAELTATDTITFYRQDTAGTIKMMLEVWRYVGSSGGPYEFITRQRGSISISGSSNTISISGMSNRNNSIPFHTGHITTIESNADYERTTIALHVNSSSQLVASCNAGSGGSATVGYEIVEFTGSAWEIGHAVSSSHDASSETVTMNTDSSGVGGSTFDVSDWSTAMIIEGTLEGDTSEVGLADIQGLWYPSGTTTQIIYSQTDIDAAARNDGSAYAHILRTANLSIYRDTNANIAEGNGTYGTLSLPTGSPTSGGLENLSLEWFVGSTGTGTAHLRGSLHAQIIDSGGYVIQHWVHRSGNDVEGRYGVADLSALIGATTEGYIDVWSGSEWAKKPIKVWTGSEWVTKPLKYWNGSSWITL